MKKNWEMEELVDNFILLPHELQLIGNKTAENRLGFCVLFKFFQHEARFPSNKNEVPKPVIQLIAKQLDVSSELFEKYDMTHRNAFYHMAQIREFFGFREATVEDANKVADWLYQYALYYDHDIEHIKIETYHRFRELCVEPPTSDRVDRIIHAAVNSYEAKFFKETYEQISPSSIEKMDMLIDSLPDDYEIGIDASSVCDIISFSMLRSDPGKPGLQCVLDEVTKLRTINQLDLPLDLFNGIPLKVIAKYKQRAVSEDIRELRRHPAHIRYTLLAAFFWVRKKEITDNLVELLIQLVHKIGRKAESKIDQEFLKEFKRVNGKPNILFHLAETALNHPNGIIKNVIYPVVSEQTLKDLVKEHKNTGLSYRQKVQTVIRHSFAHHYRQMVPKILEVLTFQSNNETYKPVIMAIELIKNYAGTGFQYFSLSENIPVDGVILQSMKEAVIEKDSQGKARINRINYEICTLQSLRDKLRCKEIWVVGADRYRNPDEDLPPDFEKRREENYKALNKPLDPEDFIADLKKEMYDALIELDTGLPKNEKVNIMTKGGKGWIRVSPFEPQPEPVNLAKLKSEMSRRWHMTNLLDILKETDFRVSFTKHFKTMAKREELDRESVQRRLILALYGLGTNTGLKRVAAGNWEENYHELLYIKRKFINKDNLRNAISDVVNNILQIRMQEIWGEGTTTCASDSKKFGAWDQNLMSEWHIRYRGRGVMIYWHVEKKATCIYSQLKTCSSSEVSAMITGLLRHCTDMDVLKNYVDSHGQSEVAFAFCNLLGFQLMPRLKAIYAQKLYRPDPGINDAFPNLQLVLTRNIDWNLIRQQYDQMIKYATALRLGTAETEAILKRFVRNNLKHPTYLALLELGKAVKTVFLCKYLHSEELRREVNEGLNVIENWNSANHFIFYGRSGEISTNDVEEQELSVLSLHLLQNCLVYINTLMYQTILSESKWMCIMTPEDYRGITPLIYNHINPYGNFELDMNKRLTI